MQGAFLGFFWAIFETFSVLPEGTIHYNTAWHWLAGQSRGCQAIPNRTEIEPYIISWFAGRTHVRPTTKGELGNIIIPSQATEEMGACNSLFSSKRQDEEDEKEGRMLALLEENRKLHEIVSSLQMELHHNRPFSGPLNKSQEILTFELSWSRSLVSIVMVL